jgi:sarcosine oxidase subunit alpha
LDSRIRKHPIIEFKREKPVQIYLNRKKIKAYEGETILAALYAAGIKSYSESVKYSRPRGFFCGIGKCSSCLMRVNGIPRVRTCLTLVEDGMTIKHEKGHGEPPLATEVEVEVTDEKVDTDLIVLGGGPAGLSAAITAAKLGVEAFIVDENPKPGGQLIKQTHKFFGSKYNYAAVRGIEIAEILLKDLRESHAKWILNASAIGYYKNKKHLIAIVQNDHKLIEVSAAKIIVSTGARENTLLFPNNDLPGIYGAGGVQTLMNVYGIKPGNEALIVGAGNVGLIVGYQLVQAGVNVKMLVEAMPKIGGYAVHAAKLRRLGIPILTRHSIKSAEGKGHVEKATIVELNETGQPIEGTEEGINVDLICLAVGLTPSSEIPSQAGCAQAYIPELGGLVAVHTEDLETTLNGMYVSGDVSGIGEANTAMMEGILAGANVAMELGKDRSKAEKIREESLRHLSALRASPFGEKVLKGKEKVWQIWREMK